MGGLSHAFMVIGFALIAVPVTAFAVDALADAWANDRPAFGFLLAFDLGCATCIVAVLSSMP